MKRSLLTGLGLALAGLTTPLAAQTVDFSYALTQVDEAVMGIAASSSDFKDDLAIVARLHGNVVAIRLPTDPQRFQCLMDQASLLLGTGDLKGARCFTEQAVAQAEFTGDILNAAHASVTAAILAQQAGDRDAERAFRFNARTLASLTEVTPAQSAAIATRLYGERWKAAGEGRSVLIDE